MEKIVIGAPYEIIIEPSIDIGEFESDILIHLEDSKINIQLKKVKGEDDTYSFIIPKTFQTILKKSKEVSYSIWVYKENARFEVDSGKMQFISEKDFKVKVKDNAKMRKVEVDKVTEEDSKKTKITEDLNEFAPEFHQPAPHVDLVTPEKNVVKEEEKNDEPIVDVKSEPVPVVTENTSEIKTVLAAPARKPNSNSIPLMKILDEVEQRKRDQDRRKQINENIRKSIKKDS